MGLNTMIKTSIVSACLLKNVENAPLESVSRAASGGIASRVERRLHKEKEAESESGAH